MGILIFDAFYILVGAEVYHFARKIKSSSF